MKVVKKQEICLYAIVFTEGTPSLILDKVFLWMKPWWRQLLLLMMDYIAKRNG